mgnify:FL=1
MSLGLNLGLMSSNKLVLNQAVTFDGVNDYANFNHSIVGTSDFTVYLDFEVATTTSGNQNVFSLKGGTSNDYGLWMRHNGTKFFLKVGNGTKNFSNDTLVTGNEYQVTIFYDASEEEVTVTQVKNGTSSTPINASGTNNAVDFATSGTEGRLAGLAWSTANVGNFIFKEFKVSQGSTANVHYDFRADAGTTTIQDLTSNNHDATVVNATMSTFWSPIYVG